jgi:hypothetical protein
MESDLLDVMRENGWSETGQDYDAVRWLKASLGEADESRREADRLSEENAALERDLEYAHEREQDLQQRLAAAQAPAAAAQPSVSP